MVRRALELLVTVALGAIVAVIGAGAYRSAPWFGLAMCLALVLLSSVFVRAWHGWWGIALYAIPWVGLTFLFAQQGPGGSLLIAGDALGTWWVYGGAGVIVLASLIPGSLLGGGKRVEG